MHHHGAQLVTVARDGAKLNIITGRKPLLWHYLFVPRSKMTASYTGDNSKQEGEQHFHEAWPSCVYEYCSYLKLQHQSSTRSYLKLTALVGKNSTRHIQVVK